MLERDIDRNSIPTPKTTMIAADGPITRQTAKFYQSAIDWLIIVSSTLPTEPDVADTWYALDAVTSALLIFLTMNRKQHGWSE